MSNVFSPLEKAAIAAGVAYLTAHKTDYVTSGSQLGGTALDQLAAAAKHLEPTHGLGATLVVPLLNTFIDNADSQEKAALPTQLGELIDWGIAKGTALESEV